MAVSTDFYYSIYGGGDYPDIDRLLTRAENEINCFILRSPETEEEARQFSFAVCAQAEYMGLCGGADAWAMSVSGTAQSFTLGSFSMSSGGSSSGSGDIDETPHVLIFKHDDNAYGDTVVVCIGKNTSGFDAVWKQNAVTPFPCTYDLESLNSDGRLAMFIDCPKGTDWDTLAKGE